MTGMDARNGRPLSGDAHLAQSIGDILTTRIGSRTCRREYGSLLPDLIDQPMNGLGRLRLFAATALAIARWEPRVRLTKVALQSTGAGAFDLGLDGVRTDAVPATAAIRLLIPLRTSTAQLITA